MPGTTIQRYHGSYLMPSLEHATVADAAHPGIVSCETDTAPPRPGGEVLCAANPWRCNCSVGAGPGEQRHDRPDDFS